MDKERDVYEERERSKNEIVPGMGGDPEEKTGHGKDYAPLPNDDPDPAPDGDEITEDSQAATRQVTSEPEIEGAAIAGSENKGPENKEIKEEEGREEEGKDEPKAHEIERGEIEKKTEDTPDTTQEEGSNEGVTIENETQRQEGRMSDQDKKPEVREEGVPDGVNTGKVMNGGAQEAEHKQEEATDDNQLTGEVEPADSGTSRQEDTNAVNEDTDTTLPEAAPVASTGEATPAVVATNQEEGSDNDKSDINKVDTPKADDHTPEGSHEEEEDQGDDDNDEGDDEQEDFTGYSKAELVRLMDSLVKENNVRKADRLLKEIKPAYDSIRDAERSEALKKFIADGGSPDDFDYKLDELDVRFDANYTLLKDRRAKHYKGVEKQKEENLTAKNDLLERLRKLVDDEETTASISALKEIQKEWRTIGQIPGQYVKNLWANYNALLDRFYDNRSIYFELKELDRKKNLEGKLELCEKVEQLETEENLKAAIKELNELHEEFKHIGPVPKEEQEPLWQRFKLASDKVYARRREYVDHLKADLHQNQEKKRALGDRVQEFLSFDSDRINDWNKKTKEILGIQKEWEAIGGLPKDSARETNKHFWSAFKGFFNLKSAFFKKLESQREENLKKKQELVQKAEALQDSTDWNKTANELKKMQQEWKTIGPVPEKFRNSVYLEFKKHCDHFFENKRSKNKEVVQEYDENLKKKEAICAEIEGMARAHSTDLVRLEQLQDEFNAAGFVPKSAIKSIQKRFMEAVNTFAKSADNLDDQERHNIELAARFNKLKSSPNSNRKIHQKENELRKQIGKLENDISLWKNNLEFFADSKKADKLKEDFNEKINNAKKELKEMQDQLYIIRNI